MKTVKRLMLAIYILGVCLSGCSGGGASTNSVGTFSSMDSAMVNEELKSLGGIYNDISYNTMDRPSNSNDGGGSIEEQTNNDVVKQDKIIYTGTIRIETLDFDNSSNTVEDLVKQYSGFIEASNSNSRVSYSDDGITNVMDRYIEYTIRIPSEYFNTVMNELDSVGNITHTSTKATNVTSQYIDIEARLYALRLQKEQLEKLLGTTKDSDVIVKIYKQLSNVIQEIEFSERSLRDLNSQINYSTIEVELSEVRGYTRAVGVQQSYLSRLGNGFVTGWIDFIEAIKEESILIANASPKLLLTAIIVILVLVANKKRKFIRPISFRRKKDNNKHD